MTTGKKTLGILVGSLRRDSFCKRVANYMSGLMGEEFEVKFLDISNLAMYNEDLDNEKDIPPEWLRLRQDVKALDAVLFVTPEYNRSVSPVLKNAMDIASRPYGAGVWSGKPGSVISVSPGNLGGYGANQHLRQIAACIGINMMLQPEAYIGGIINSVDDNTVVNKNLQDFLKLFANAFSAWINRFTA